VRDRVGARGLLIRLRRVARGELLRRGSARFVVNVGRRRRAAGAGSQINRTSMHTKRVGRMVGDRCYAARARSISR
jgi:hypothetical protein